MENSFPPRSRHFYLLINYLPAMNFSKFLRDFPMKTTGILESKSEIPIPDPPARGAIPAVHFVGGIGKCSSG
jgi:hypothetical protein